MKETKKETVRVGDRTVVRITKDEGIPPENNLFILDAEENVIWDMSRVLKNPDSAVLMRVEGKIMHFTTFNGLHFGIDTVTLEVTEKNITK